MILRVRALMAVLAGVLLSFAMPCRAEVIINELMYHPPDGVRDLEYIELYNTDIVPVEIGRWAFTDGVRFTFPEGTAISGNGYLVVCANEADVRAHYGIANAIGNYAGRLDSAGERVELRNESGGLMDWVDYDDEDLWPAAPDGTGHSLSLLDEFSDPGRPELWAPSETVGGTPGQVNFGRYRQALVPAGETWRFFRGTAEPSVPADAWRQLAFNDASWETGPSGFGYGDADDATVLDDMQNAYWTVFARKLFVVPDRTKIRRLWLQIDYDDGFHAFLNGKNIANANVTGTAYNAPAGSDHEAGALELFEIDPGELVNGANVLAVQGHNNALESSDFTLEPALYTLIDGPQPPPDRVVFNEIFAGNGTQSWIELYNRTSSPADLSGYWLSDSAAVLKKQLLPTETVLAAKQLLAVGLPISATHGKVFLTRPDGRQVVAAAAHEPDDPAFSLGRYPDGGARWYRMPTRSRGTANPLPVETGIVINEIMYRPYSDTQQDEYVELYNRGTATVDLGGWAFTQGIDFAFGPHCPLAAGEYLVVAKDAARIASVYNIGNVTGNYDKALSNTGERLVLVDTVGNVVDEVRWYDEGRWPPRADGAGPSLELVDPRQPNDDASAWAPSDTFGKTAWQRYVVTGIHGQGESELHLFLLNDGVCLIDNLSVKDDYQVEHMPNGNFETDLAGWTVTGTHEFSARDTSEASSGNASLRVFAMGRGQPDDNKLEIDLVPQLVPGAVYTISFDARWLVGSNHLCVRTHGNDGVSRTVDLPVPADLGTPGRRNSRYSANAAPIVGPVQIEPVAPVSGQAVTVRTRVADADGVGSVSVWYAIDPSETYLEIPMNDSGTSGDAIAGDGVYSGQLPGQTNGRVVAFYVRAQDAGGQIRFWPAVAPFRTGTYRVEDKPSLGLGPLYDIVMRSIDAGALGSPRMGDALRGGSLIVDGRKAYLNVGIRYRGSPFARPNGYRVRLGQDDPLHRTYAINFDGLRGDLAFQQERLTFQLMRWLGNIPTPRQEYVRVRLNGLPVAMHERVQRIDPDYVEAYFPGDDDGPLHKVDEEFIFADDGSFTAVHADFHYRGADEEAYRWHFNLRANEKADNYTGVIDLCRFMDPLTTSDEAFDASAEALLMVDNWVRVFAVRAAVASWDSIGFWRGKNAYLYRPPADGRWALLPWDDDLSWLEEGLPLPLFNPYLFPDVSRFLRRPWVSRMYYTYIRQLLDGRFSVEQTGPWARTHYRVVGAAGAARPEDIEDFITARRAFIESVWPPESPFAIATNGGQPFTTREQPVRLAGTAPFRVTQIWRGIERLDVSFDTLSEWSAAVELAEGANPITLAAYDREGRFVAQASTEIFYVPQLDRLPIRTGFEAEELPPFVTGLLPQNAWAGEGLVQDVTAAEGRQALQVAGRLERPVDASGERVLWVDYRLRAAGNVSPVTPVDDPPACAMVFNATDGVLALDGDGGGGAWMALNVPFDPLRFMRVTWRIDYDTQTWDVYLNGELRAQSLGLAQGAAEPTVVRWAFGEETVVDQMYIGAQAPADLGIAVPWSLY